MAALLLLPLAAGSWTEWRGGPDNAATDLGLAPRTGALLWKYDTGNQVLSSPVFYDGGMLIGSDDGNLYCLDPATGELNWKYRTKGEVQSTALVKDGRAYFGSFDRHFYCIDLPEGGAQPRKVWSYPCDGQIISSAHMIDGDPVFADLNGTVYRLGADGSLKWRTDIGDEVWASPLIDEATSMIYIGDITGRFVSMDGRNGVIKEDTDLGDLSECYGTAVLHDGAVYVTNGIGGSLLGLDKETLEVRYRFHCGHATYSSPVVSGDRLYIGSFDYAWCVPLTDDDGNITPEEVVWSFRTHDFQGGSSPLVMDDAVIIGSDDHRLYCLDRETGTERFNFSADGYIYSSPASHEDGIYFGSSDWSIYCVGDPGSGSLNVEVSFDPQETTADGPVEVSIRVTDGTGAPVIGARVDITASAGDIDYAQGARTTGPSGTMTATLDPFPVSSRSTLEVRVTAVSGNRSGRAKASIIVEPGTEDSSGDPDVISPYRIWYFVGIAAITALNAGLGVFMFMLYRKTKAVGRR